MGSKILNVTIIDMQPITPAIGGGRQRLLGLYHALGEDIKATYVGSYDWPGEAFRDQQLTPGLREICVPLSEEHHAAAARSAQRLEGKVVIDLEFCDQVKLSPEYLEVARRHIAEADVVVFSHPWAYPALRDAVRPSQLLVYDSQNVEVVLRTALLGQLHGAQNVLHRVAEIEYDLCREADLILACSHDDRECFGRVMDIEPARIRVVPNGIFAFAQAAPEHDQRVSERRQLGVKRDTLAVFLGSDYGPNNEAARFIATTLAPRLPNVEFALIGSCCNGIAQLPETGNVRLLGVVADDVKSRWMRAASIALNPLAAGSGTSIKMFDYMAAGLATVTTEIGGRGIACTGEPAFHVVDLADFPAEVARLVEDRRLSEAMGRRARRVVEDFYAWERISPTLGILLKKRQNQKRGALPYISVVIPTYERHAMLGTVVEALREQSFRDFEVIVIDQSASPWPGASDSHGFELTYVHSPVKGAVKARNLGGMLASGDIVAFTDDDCQPRKNWLQQASERFSHAGVVGVEGRIVSDHLNDPDWRPVTNVGFESIGFMTANLFVRNSVFQRLNGFDLAFDDPHFREDTDFGWRMQDLGAVPYAEEVEVFHPAHRRDVERESNAERNKFFEKDALLLKKHPCRYRDLFFAECHFRNTNGFSEHFRRGAQKYHVEIPDWAADQLV